MRYPTHLTVIEDAIGEQAASAVPDPGSGPAGRFVLIDSSVWVEALNPRGLAVCKEAARTVLADGTAAVCEVVLTEVLRGARDETDAEWLHEQLRAPTNLHMRGSGPVAARLSRMLRAQGKMFAVSDLLICGTAVIHGAALMHRDKHLGQIAEIAGIEQILP